MWCYRKILNIRWVDKMTNREVLNLVKEKRSLNARIKRRHDRLIQHTHSHEGLAGIILESRVEGRKGKGRQRLEHVYGRPHVRSRNRRLKVISIFGFKMLTRYLFFFCVFLKILAFTFLNKKKINLYKIKIILYIQYSCVKQSFYFYTHFSVRQGSVTP